MVDKNICYNCALFGTGGLLTERNRNMNMAERIAGAAAFAVALPLATTAEDGVLWTYNDSARTAEVSSSAVSTVSGGIETFGAESAHSNGVGRFRSISGATRIVVR